MLTDLVEYFVVGVPDLESLGPIIPAIQQLSEAGTLRLLDWIVVERDADGTVRLPDLAEAGTAAGARADRPRRGRTAQWARCRAGGERPAAWHRRSRPGQRGPLGRAARRCDASGWVAGSSPVNASRRRASRAHSSAVAGRLEEDEHDRRDPTRRGIPAERSARPCAMGRSAASRTVDAAGRRSRRSARGAGRAAGARVAHGRGVRPPEGQGADA